MSSFDCTQPLECPKVRSLCVNCFNMTVSFVTNALSSFATASFKKLVWAKLTEQIKSNVIVVNILMKLFDLFLRTARSSKQFYCLSSHEPPFTFFFYPCQHHRKIQWNIFSICCMFNSFE